MQVGDRIDFEAPLGRFTLHAGSRPLLMVAGATGFAPIKSILEDAFARGVQRQMQLYWGVSDARDLRSEEHTSELQSLMRISYAVFCLKKKHAHQQGITKDRTLTTLHTRQ